MNENFKQERNNNNHERISQNFKVDKKSKRTRKEYSIDERRISLFTRENQRKLEDLEFENPFLVPNSVTKKHKRHSRKKNDFPDCNASNFTDAAFMSQCHSQSVSYTNEFEQYFSYKYSNKPLILHDIPEKDTSNTNQKEKRKKSEKYNSIQKTECKTTIMKSLEIRTKNKCDQETNQIVTPEKNRTIKLVINPKNGEKISKKKIILQSGEKNIRLNVNLNEAQLKGSIASIKIKGNGNLNIVHSNSKVDEPQNFHRPTILYCQSKPIEDNKFVATTSVTSEKSKSSKVEICIKCLPDNQSIQSKAVKTKEVYKHDIYLQHLDKISNLLYPTFIPSIISETEPPKSDAKNEYHSTQETEIKAQDLQKVEKIPSLNVKNPTLPRNRPKLLTKPSKSLTTANFRKRKSCTKLTKNVKPGLAKTIPQTTKANKCPPKNKNPDFKINVYVPKMLRSKPKVAIQTNGKSVADNGKMKKDVQLILFKPSSGVKEIIKERAQFWTEKKIFALKDKKKIKQSPKIFGKSKKKYRNISKRFNCSKINRNRKEYVKVIMKTNNNSEDLFTFKKPQKQKIANFTEPIKAQDGNQSTIVPKAEEISRYPKMIQHFPIKKSKIPIRRTNLKNKNENLQISKTIFKIWSESVLDNLINTKTNDTRKIAQSKNFRPSSERGFEHSVKSFKKNEMSTFKSHSEQFSDLIKNGSFLFPRKSYQNMNGDNIKVSEEETIEKIKQFCKKPAPKSISEIKSFDKFIKRYRDKREMLYYSNLTTDFQIYHTHTVQPKKPTKPKIPVLRPTTPSSYQAGSSRIPPSPAAPKSIMKARLKPEMIPESKCPKPGLMSSVIQKIKNIAKDNYHPNEFVTTTIIPPKAKMNFDRLDHHKMKQPKKSQESKPKSPTKREKLRSIDSHKPKAQTVQVMLLKRTDNKDKTNDLTIQKQTSVENIKNKELDKIKTINRQDSPNSIGGAEDLFEQIKKDNNDIAKPLNKSDNASNIALRTVSSLELIRRSSLESRGRKNKRLRQEKETLITNPTYDNSIENERLANETRVLAQEKPAQKQRHSKEVRKKVQFPNSEPSNDPSTNNEYEFYSRSMDNISNGLKQRKSDAGKDNISVKSSHNYLKNIKSIFSKESKPNQNQSDDNKLKDSRDSVEMIQAEQTRRKSSLKQTNLESIINEPDFYTEELYVNKKKATWIQEDEKAPSVPSSENFSSTRSEPLEQTSEFPNTPEESAYDNLNKKSSAYSKEIKESIQPKVCQSQIPIKTESEKVRSKEIKKKRSKSKPNWQSTSSLEPKKISFVDDLKKLTDCDKIKKLWDSFHKGVYDDLISENPKEENFESLKPIKVSKSISKKKKVNINESKLQEKLSKRSKSNFSISKSKSNLVDKVRSNTIYKSCSKSAKSCLSNEDDSLTKCCSEYFEKNLEALKDMKCFCPKVTQSQPCGCRSEPLEIQYSCQSSQIPPISACKCKSSPDSTQGYSKARSDTIFNDYKSDLKDFKITSKDVSSVLAESQHDLTDHQVEDSEVFVVNPEEIGICFRRGFRPDSLALNGQLCYRYVKSAKLIPANADDPKQTSLMINFSERETPLDFLVALGFSVDEASTALKDDQVKNRLTAAITEAKVWANEITTMQGTLLYVIAYKAKSQVMRYFLQLVEAIVNRRITDVVKLDGFLQLIYKLEMGYLPMLLIFGSDTFEADNDENRMLAKQLQRLFANMFKIAENEAESLNIPFTSNTTKLLQYLIKMYKPGMHSHLELMAKYVGQGLITTEVQLEAALIYLSRLETTNFNLREFEQYCGLQQLKE